MLSIGMPPGELREGRRPYGIQSPPSIRMPPGQLSEGNRPQVFRRICICRTGDRRRRFHSRHVSNCMRRRRRCRRFPIRGACRISSGSGSQSRQTIQTESVFRCPISKKSRRSAPSVLVDLSMVSNQKNLVPVKWMQGLETPALGIRATPSSSWGRRASRCARSRRLSTGRPWIRRCS